MKAIIKFLWRVSVLTNCLIEKIKIPDTYYINNDYTNVQKFMKSSSKSEQAVNTKSVERQKK